ncbi:hypothetical protein DM01DRAFT_1335980 [Hesseltinella vesiculosa]|uniref:SUN domain-containing protein n=1 Tax=Hesseltinella vesiculosa TaxID=101127 RepID=A0A1X2GHZ6_9FUNG|nr:hypothetical protein DM01DRAFT_1335980 [Hesseltinella vesiculosa]
MDKSFTDPQRNQSANTSFDTDVTYTDANPSMGANESIDKPSLADTSLVIPSPSMPSTSLTTSSPDLLAVADQPPVGFRAFLREQVITLVAYGTCVMYLFFREMLVLIISVISLAFIHPFVTRRFSRFFSSVFVTFLLISAYRSFTATSQPLLSPSLLPSTLPPLLSTSYWANLGQHLTDLYHAKNTNPHTLFERIHRLQTELLALDRQDPFIQTLIQQMNQLSFPEESSPAWIDQALSLEKTAQQALEQWPADSPSTAQASSTLSPVMQGQDSLQHHVRDSADNWLQQQLADGHLVERAGVQDAVMQALASTLKKAQSWSDHLVVSDLVHDALYRYHHDIINLPDYALSTRGARILSAYSSSTFDPSKHHGLRMRLWHWLAGTASTDPRIAITPGTQVGQCWPMDGQQGSLGIQLSEPIAIESISIDHPGPSLAGNPASAPRTIDVWGLKKIPGPLAIKNASSRLATDDNAVLLGTIDYDTQKAAQHKDVLMTFPLTKDTSSLFQAVVLLIQSNHGHHDYTCIYRVRVHGKP